MKRICFRLLLIFCMASPACMAEGFKFEDFASLKIGIYCSQNKDMVGILYRITNNSESGPIKFTSNQINLSGAMPPIFNIVEVGKEKSEMLGYKGLINIESPPLKTSKSGYYLFENDNLIVDYPISQYYDINSTKSYTVEFPVSFYLEHKSLVVNARLKFNLENACEKTDSVKWVKPEIINKWFYDESKKRIFTSEK